MIKKTLAISAILASMGVSAQQHDQYTYDPAKYTSVYTDEAPNIDGKIDDDAWDKVSWSEAFRDIEGDIRPNPYFETKVKMMWDDEYFYIAAEMEETDIWATYTQRDAVIFHENDFEVFIDPDDDTHNYYELEINALGTVWDLILTKPYRDHGKAINGWDIAGLKKGIYLDGTINDPSDKDRKWSVELAFPWEILKEAAPRKQKPREGDLWRINFSRVQWRTEAKDGTYVKQIDPKTGKSYPEYNWVWSPQGRIAMHQPETWGFVQFAKKDGSFEIPESDKIKWQLRQAYYAQQEYAEKNDSYATDLGQLDLSDDLTKNLRLQTTETLFEISTTYDGRTWYIYQDGKIISMSK